MSENRNQIARILAAASALVFVIKRQKIESLTTPGVGVKLYGILLGALEQAVDEWTGEPTVAREATPAPGVATPEEARAPYGYCPTCFAPGIARERRPNGDDRCKNGHKYPAVTALPRPLNERVPVRGGG